MIELLRFWARCKQMWCLPVPTVNNMPAEFLKRACVYKHETELIWEMLTPSSSLTTCAPNSSNCKLMIPLETPGPWTCGLWNLQLLMTSGNTLAKRETPSLNSESKEVEIKRHQIDWGHQDTHFVADPDPGCQSQPVVSCSIISSWWILNSQIKSFWKTVIIKKNIYITKIIETVKS